MKSGQETADNVLSLTRTWRQTLESYVFPSFRPFPPHAPYFTYGTNASPIVNLPYSHPHTSTRPHPTLHRP
nr:hypothetical transcript [Hymenolepis microstoma]